MKPNTVEGPRDLFRLLNEARALRPMPAVTDEAAFRGWCRKAVTLAVDAASQSEEVADDEAARILAAIVGTDAAWARAYPLVRDFADPSHDPDPVDLAEAESVDLACGPLGKADKVMSVLYGLCAAAGLGREEG